MHDAVVTPAAALQADCLYPSPPQAPIRPEGDVHSGTECLAFFGFLAGMAGALSALIWFLQGMPPI